MLRNLLGKTALIALKDKLAMPHNANLCRSLGSCPLMTSKSFAWENVKSPSTSTTHGSNLIQIRNRCKTLKPCPPTVKHNSKDKMFFIEVPECRAELHYERDGAVITIHHAHVPINCTKRGFGKLLTRAAFEWIAKNNYRVIINCDFVEDYVDNYMLDFHKYVLRGN